MAICWNFLLELKIIPDRSGSGIKPVFLRQDCIPGPVGVVIGPADSCGDQGNPGSCHVIAAHRFGTVNDTDVLHGDGVRIL